MTITCPDCGKSFQVDEARLPARPVALKCPACGGRISVAAEGAPPPSEGAAPARKDLPEEGNGLRPGTPAWDRLRREVAADVLRHLGVAAGSLGPDDEADLGDDGQKTALVCEDEALFQVAISEILERQGYAVDLAVSKAAALEALGRKQFGLVTVDNCYGDDPEGGFAILQSINALPPEMRRSMYVAFVSVDLSTMDTRSAFILGANLTVSKKDVKKLDRILSQGMREHANLYRVFRKVEEELQKAEG
ncbi:MAG: zinc-ribbon domain-containing protein [Acidobacteriota bacterium]